MHGLSKSHLVRENTAHPPAAQRPEPLYAPHLIVQQLGTHQWLQAHRPLRPPPRCRRAPPAVRDNEGPIYTHAATGIGVVGVGIIVVVAVVVVERGGAAIVVTKGTIVILVIRVAIVVVAPTASIES